MGISVRPGFFIPDSELRIRFTSSGGPGGQHANRSNTRVELTWNISSSRVIEESVRRRLIGSFGPIIRVVVDDERSQLRNREMANVRLRSRVLDALHEPRRRRESKPSRSSERRRIDKKKQRGQLKRDRQRPQRDD